MLHKSKLTCHKDRTRSDRTRLLTAAAEDRTAIQEAQPVNGVRGNTECSLRQPQEARKYNAEFLYVKARGTYSTHCALNYLLTLSIPCTDCQYVRIICGSSSRATAPN
jgi:hypothetical protein